MLGFSCLFIFFGILLVEFLVIYLILNLFWTTNFIHYYFLQKSDFKLKSLSIYLKNFRMLCYDSNKSFPPPHLLPHQSTKDSIVYFIFIFYFIYLYKYIFIYFSKVYIVNADVNMIFENEEWKSKLIYH